MIYGEATIATLLIIGLVAINESAAFILPGKQSLSKSPRAANLHRRHGINQHREGIETNDNPNQHRGWISSYPDDQPSPGDASRVEYLTRRLDDSSWNSSASSIIGEDGDSPMIVVDDGGEEAWLDDVARIMTSDRAGARSKDVHRAEKVRQVQEMTMGPCEART